MQKFSLKLSGTLLGTFLIFLAPSCSQGGKNDTPAGAKGAVTQEATVAPTALKVAYVQLDSVLNNYQQYKDMQQRLEKKGNDSRASLTAKMNALQRAGADFQQKLQNNQFLTREAAEAEQNRLMKMEQEVQKLNATLSEQMLKEQQAAEEKLYNTIKERIAELNKEWGYDLILTNVRADNMLYGNPDLDITGAVIAGLNEGYTQEATPEATPAPAKK
ncbi:OmpH family outer membrane protein [Porphyromonas circumdentaria]|uniref:Periplasmic chaperone for outer membrane proteins Skp n=1 Tax=Porphyromonas circumdentaria TaxID=29524 RepID=A0A1T4PBR6_9PORP|nr:OmpH family outer membrane protein [Porphyromonas circumdentaria]MBB6276364.1 outer membrane protein [Porphyromonas circumdentaria]MDO4722860.1 OmpH family outer membrane protein [Porphyromonas circumdentaria]SJZ88811.1 periplasmic chaperone for outer membrane proteins Skp [Porphyromonas circumdentaria]